MVAILVPDVEIQVGTYHTIMPIFVTELCDNLILGLDFLLSNGAELNQKYHNYVQLIPMTPTYNKNRGVQLASLARQVYIAPGGEANLSTVSNKHELHLFEPAVCLINRVKSS